MQMGSSHACITCSALKPPEGDPRRQLHFVRRSLRLWPLPVMSLRDVLVPARELLRFPDRSPRGLRAGIGLSACCSVTPARGRGPPPSSGPAFPLSPKAGKPGFPGFSLRSQNAAVKRHPVYPRPVTDKTRGDGFLFLFLVTEKQCALVAACQVLMKHGLWAGMRLLKQDTDIPAQVAKDSRVFRQSYPEIVLSAIPVKGHSPVL